MRKIVKRIRSILFPPHCGICNDLTHTRGALCQNCQRDVSRILPPVCTKCGRGRDRCTCETTFIKDFSVGAPFYYEGKVRDAVLRFKLSGQLHRGQTFAAEMAEFIRQRWSADTFDGIVPVPMTPKGRRKRGSDPVMALAKELSSITNIPIMPCLRKVRDTKPQRSLRASMRRANVYDAFRVVSDVEGKNLLLIDDVITTGSTVAEIVKILQSAGCSRVCACSIALTPKDR